MAANQKPVFATTHIVAAGNRLPYAPGERIDERMPEHAWKAALEQGLATDDPKQGDTAASSEADRQADVADQIENRSEKRGQSRKSDDVAQ